MRRKPENAIEIPKTNPSPRCGSSQGQGIFLNRPSQIGGDVSRSCILGQEAIQCCSSSQEERPEQNEEKASQPLVISPRARIRWSWITEASLWPSKS